MDNSSHQQSLPQQQLPIPLFTCTALIHHTSYGKVLSRLYNVPPARNQWQSQPSAICMRVYRTHSSVQLRLGLELTA
jgi:hypothetical protein